MSPRYFSKQMQSPYFKTKYYEEEAPSGKMEKRIELFFSRLIKKIWKSKNV